MSRAGSRRALWIIAAFTLACRREPRGAMPSAPPRPGAAVDGAACASVGAPCCAGSVCEGRFNCVAGTCQPCGQRPLPCCTNAPTPCRNGVCIDGACAVPPRTCGHRDQPCCAGQCGGSYRCVDGLCRPRDADCGEVGQRCCPEEHRDDCGMHLHCTNGVCLPSTCGHEGEPCCDREERCGPRFACVEGVCRLRPGAPPNLPGSGGGRGTGGGGGMGTGGGGGRGGR